MLDILKINLTAEQLLVYLYSKTWLNGYHFQQFD